MQKPLKVLVHGTGFAGQGHAQAFTDVGAEVVGIVGRTEEVVARVAADLGIGYAGTDWAQALRQCRPDIVSIATPGGAHQQAIEQALEFGCHVFSDKPLTTSGDSARALYQLAEAKKRKTAYAASFRYMPEVLHAQRLVRQGVIGEPLEVECISHFNLERDIPFGWSHRKEQGGGRLNNNFTHKLSIVTAIVGEQILSVCGEVRDDLRRAPIVEGVHNFKTRRDFIPKDLNSPELRWGDSNVEWSYTVMAQLQSPFAERPVSVLFKHGGLHPRFDHDHIVIYGSEGALYIKGHYASGPLYSYRDQQWQQLPLPNDIARVIPDVAGDTERNWRYLMTQFVNDIQGRQFTPYQSFAQGAQYQQLIDIIRTNNPWTDVTHTI